MTAASVGHDVAGHAPLDPHRLELLGVLAPVEHHAARLVALERGEDRGQAVHGVDPHPGPGRVGPAPAHRTTRPQGALATGLDDTAGGLAQHGRVGGEEIGTGRRPAGPGALWRRATSSHA